MSKREFIAGQPADLIGIDLIEQLDGSFQIEEIAIRNARVDDHGVTIRFEIKKGARWKTAAVSIAYQLGKPTCESDSKGVFGRAWCVREDKPQMTQGLINGCLAILDARIERLQQVRLSLLRVGADTQPEAGPRQSGPGGPGGPGAPRPF